MKLNNTAIEFISVCDDPSGYRSYLYAVRALPSGERVGSCCLRLETKKGALRTLGNIGYEIDQGARGVGYATNACRMLACEAKKLGLYHPAVCCLESNIASICVLQGLGAELLEGIDTERGKVLRYRLK